MLLLSNCQKLNLVQSGGGQEDYELGTYVDDPFSVKKIDVLFFWEVVFVSVVFEKRNEILGMNAFKASDVDSL